MNHWHTQTVRRIGKEICKHKHTQLDQKGRVCSVSWPKSRSFLEHEAISIWVETLEYRNLNSSAEPESHCVSEELGWRNGIDVVSLIAARVESAFSPHH